MLGHYSASKFAVRGLDPGRGAGVGAARHHGQRLLPRHRRHGDVGATSTRSSPRRRACRRARRSPVLRADHARARRDARGRGRVRLLPRLGRLGLHDGAVRDDRRRGAVRMKAAVFHGPRDIRLEDVPEPSVRPGQRQGQGRLVRDLRHRPARVPRRADLHPAARQPAPDHGRDAAAHARPRVRGRGRRRRRRASRASRRRPRRDRAGLPLRRVRRVPARRAQPVRAARLLRADGRRRRHVGVRRHALLHGPRAARRADERAGRAGRADRGRPARGAPGRLRAGESALVFGGGPIGAVTVQCLKALGAGQIIVAEVVRRAQAQGARDRRRRRHRPDRGGRRRARARAHGRRGRRPLLRRRRHPGDAAGRAARTRKGGTVTIISIWEGPVQINPNDIVLSELARPSGRSPTRRRTSPTRSRCSSDGSIRPRASSPSASSSSDIVARRLRRARRPQGPPREDPRALAMS